MNSAPNPNPTIATLTFPLVIGGASSRAKTACPNVGGRDRTRPTHITAKSRSPNEKSCRRDKVFRSRVLIDRAPTYRSRRTYFAVAPKVHVGAVQLDALPRVVAQKRAPLGAQRFRRSPRTHVRLGLQITPTPGLPNLLSLLHDRPRLLRRLGHLRVLGPRLERDLPQRLHALPRADRPE